MPAEQPGQLSDSGDFGDSFEAVAILLFHFQLSIPILDILRRQKIPGNRPSHHSHSLIPNAKVKLNLYQFYWMELPKKCATCFYNIEILSTEIRAKTLKTIYRAVKSLLLQVKLSAVYI